MRQVVWSETARQIVAHVTWQRPSRARMRELLGAWFLRLHAKVAFDAQREAMRALRARSAPSAEMSLRAYRLMGWTQLVCCALAAESLPKTTRHFRFELYYLCALLKAEIELRRVLGKYADLASGALLAHVIRCELDAAARLLGSRRRAGCTPSSNSVDLLCLELETNIVAACREWAHSEWTFE